MKNYMKVNILVILGISLALLLNTGGSSIYAQNLINQTNQTSGQNNTQQLGQQLEQANQQLAQANQTQQQVSNQAQQQLANQTQSQPTQSNQTQQQPGNQSKQQDPKMNEKLLNFTNNAILALNDDNTSAAQDSLVQIQKALIIASGKPVVIVPAPAVAPSSSDDDSD